MEATYERRRGFRALIDQGIDVGVIGRTTYRVTREDDGSYSGTATAAQSDWSGPRKVTDRYRFTLGRALSTLAILAALAAPALATDAGAPALNARPSASAIAPGGNISSVVQETELHGWPHSPTFNEARDVTALVLARKVPRAGSVFCRFGFTMGRSTCTTKIAKTRRTYSVKVWEDGSYKITRKANR